MKKSISILLVLILAFTLVVSVYAASGDTIVYCTSSGSKYHKDGCSSLKGNGVAITLQEAVDKGLEPCSKCNPPTLDTADSSSTAASETAEASEAATAVAGTAAAAASVTAAKESRHISPLLTFILGFLAGAIVMVIVYRKFAPDVLAAQAEEEEAEESEEE